VREREEGICWKMFVTLRDELKEIGSKIAVIKIISIKSESYLLSSML